MNELSKKHLANSKAVSLDDFLSFVQDKTSNQNNQPKVDISYYGVDGKWCVDAGVHYDGENGKSECKSFLLKGYKNYWRAEKFSKELVQEHNFNFKDIVVELTDKDMWEQYLKRKNAQKVVTEEIKRELDHHSDELVTVIDTHVQGDEQGKSYLTGKEVENLLNNHFIRIENLLKSYEKQPKKASLPEHYRDLKQNLMDFSNDFKNSIVERTTTSKEKMDGKVNEMLNDVRDSVTGVKNIAKMKVKQAIIFINEHIKEFTKAVDYKLYEHETGQLNPNVSEKEVISKTKKSRKLQPLER